MPISTVELGASWDQATYLKVWDDFQILIQLHPLEGVPEAELAQWEEKVVQAAQYHWHSHTCKKNNHDGTDFSCRMQYLRLIIKESVFVPGTKGSCFLLRRDQGNIVPYCRTVLLACPSNHTISLFSEVSRYARQLYLWEEAMRKNPDCKVSGNT